MEWKKLFLRKRMIGVFVALFFAALFLFLYSAEEKQERSDEQSIASFETAQKEYVDGFHASIEAVVEQADSMGGISIFAQADSFAKRNLEKTKQDFQGLLSVEPVDFDAEFLTSFLENSVLNGIIVICGIIVAINLVDEKQVGLRSMIFSTPKGRGHLALRKIEALLVWDILLVLIFYGGMFFCCCIRYQGNFLDCLSYPVQSLQIFANLPWKINIGTFLFCYLFYRCVILFLIMLVVWCFLFCLDHFLFAMGAVAVTGILEYLAFAFIPANNPLCLLKYCNLWYLMSGIAYFTEYRNLNIFGHAVNKNQLIGIGWVIFTGLLIAAGVWTGSKRYPTVSHAGKLQKKLKGFRKKMDSCYAGMLERLPLAGSEYYKILISQRGLILLIFLTVIFVHQTDFTDIQKSAVQEMYYQFMEQYEGVPDVASEQAITEEKEAIASIEKEYSEKTELYEQGKLSEDEWIRSQIQFEALQNERLFLEQIEQQTQYLEQLKNDRGIDGWYVNIYPYNHLLETEDSLVNVLLILGVVMLCSGIFSREKKCGMLSVIRGTVRGRALVFRKKMQAAVVLAVILYLLAAGLELGAVIHVYGLSGWNAPVQSLEQLSFVPFSCSIGSFVSVLYLIRGMMLIVVAIATSMFSARTNQKLTLILSISLCIPALLGLAGFDLLQYLSIVRVLSIAPFLLQVKKVEIIAVSSGLFVLLGIYCFQDGYRKWCKT